MAAIEQAKLDAMCTKLNNVATTYVGDFNSSVNAIKNEFDTNWVSESAKDLADEISKKLTALAEDIQNTFNNKSEDIKKATIKFNIDEQENIVYQGFTFEMPNTEITLNPTLPNGKKGLADNADLNSIKSAMDTLVSKVETILDEISKTVKEADAFDEANLADLAASILVHKTNFVSGMAQLTSTLGTRMSNEIALRDALRNAMSSDLSA